MSPKFDIPQLRYIELPSNHPETKSPCVFDTSPTPVYPRNSYDVPTPPDHDPDSSWWPDGLLELDPRPRNLSKACRKAIKAGPRNHFLRNLIKLIGEYRPYGEKDICREYIYQSKLQETRRQKAKKRLETAVNRAAEEEKEKVRKAIVEKEARKEFQERNRAKNTAHSILKNALHFIACPPKLKDLILSDFNLTEQETSQRKLLRPWATSSPPPLRRHTICYHPPNPETIRKENLKKTNETEAAVKLYAMWADSPLGFPAGEEPGDLEVTKEWEEYMRQVRSGEIKAGERRRY